MGPGIGVRGRAASAALKPIVVFSGDKFTVTREGRDRYKMSDAYTVSIKTAQETENLLKERVAEHQKLAIQMTKARQELRKISSASDASPAAELVRKVQAAAPLRLVPQTPVEVEEKKVVASPEPTKRYKAPAKKVYRKREKKQPAVQLDQASPAFRAEPENDNALANVPHKVDAAAAPAPKRRVGGLSYLKMLAAQEVVDEVPQHAAAV